jgi:hypothetical protein
MPYWLIILVKNNAFSMFKNVNKKLRDCSSKGKETSTTLGLIITSA